MSGRVQLGFNPLNGMGNSLDMVGVGSGQARNVSVGDGQHLLHRVDAPSQDPGDVHGEADGDEELSQGGDLQVASFPTLLRQQLVGHLQKMVAEMLLFLKL